MAGTYYENTSAALLGWGSAVDEAKRFHSPGNMRISTLLVIECDRLLTALRAERDALHALIAELEEALAELVEQCGHPNISGWVNIERAIAAIDAAMQGEGDRNLP